MENASKALIIAGEVLIAVLIISLLVVFYNNIKDFLGTKETVVASEQVAEFNKQYDVYYRNNLYGSDILSLANKIYDYNKRESEAEGYTTLEMQVTFKYNITISHKEIVISKKEVYSAENLKQKSQYLDDNIDSYGEEIILNTTTVKALSALRTSEQKQLLGIEGDIPIEIQSKIAKYLGYKSALATLKSRTFRAESFEYDTSNGRIILMKFTEN